MIAYHGTKDVEAVLREGLRPELTESLGCPTKHICLAERPGVAAWESATVLAVDLSGFEIPEEGSTGVRCGFTRTSRLSGYRSWSRSRRPT